ncbi:hypothetical protein [Acidimangrovimonas pyrenivorans]|uniref:Uncharacterized protein n=1 Tax=Acidimangrovimonas pyrenivorans TaxID=2030798 RepID=A0ABV7AJS1_9RHOB
MSCTGSLDAEKNAEIADQVFEWVKEVQPQIEACLLRLLSEEFDPSGQEQAAAQEAAE